MDARTPSHDFLDHTAETRLLVRAATFGELLAEAARGLGELERRGAQAGPPGPGVEIGVRAPDRAALLVEWLNELVWRSERESAVPSEIEVVEAADQHLVARVRFARLPDAPALVKAATLHGLRLESRDGMLEAEVTLDI
jgi:SHS2 domain-containing protein